MRSFTLGLAAFLLAVPALTASAVAQDAPKPDAAKEERKVSKEALAVLEGWGKAMHLPQRTKAGTIVAHAKATNRQLFQGGELTVKVTWKRESGLDLAVTLPDSMVQRLPPEAVEMAKSTFRTWSREALSPAFESPEQYAKDYNVGERKEGERTVVELLPYTADAAAELQLLYFDENGLCERRVMIPRVDPNDPNQQMMVGVEVESSFGYEKIGERYVLKRMSMLLPFGEMLVEYSYYEITGGTPLLKSMSMVTPFAPDPIEVVLSDYSADGQDVPETKPQEEKPGDETVEEPAEDGAKEEQPTPDETK